jgi:hypothetical protein
MNFHSKVNDVEIFDFEIKITMVHNQKSGFNSRIILPKSTL